MAYSMVVPHILRKRGESKAIGLDGLVVAIIGVLIAIIGALQRKGRKEMCYTAFQPFRQMLTGLAEPRYRENGQLVDGFTTA
jgi:hypothetical protein